MGIAGCAGPVPQETLPKVAYFQSDVTPPLGQLIIRKMPIVVVDEPLLVKGLVLEERGTRYVLAALDWCTMGPAVYPVFRKRLAEGAGTTESRVATHSIHTHSAPFQDDVDPGFLKEATDRAGAAAHEAVARLRPFSHVGAGKAKVTEFASNRRVPGPEGKILVRYSATKDASLRAQPEGLIDPWLRTVTLFDGEKPLVRMHYYATHPQSFYGAGRVHPDTPGWARSRLEKEEGIPHLYFTGCAGNVTAGKYNDGTPEARARLIDRLIEGMKGAIADTRREPAGALAWKTAPVEFVPRPKEPVEKWPPIDLTRLTLGPVEILGLPGEPFVEFQLHAQSLRPDRFVCVAGYGDGGPEYICTDDAAGGYEPTASHVGPPSEQLLRAALRRLLE
jgi:hypothetical protein